MLNLYIRSSYRVFDRNTRYCPSVLSELRVVARFVRDLILFFFNLLLPHCYLNAELVLKVRSKLEAIQRKSLFVRF